MALESDSCQSQLLVEAGRLVRFLRNNLPTDHSISHESLPQGPTDQRFSSPVRPRAGANATQHLQRRAVCPYGPQSSASECENAERARDAGLGLRRRLWNSALTLCRKSISGLYYQRIHRISQRPFQGGANPSSSQTYRSRWQRAGGCRFQSAYGKVVAP
jgi:hypothetical protein